MTWPEVIAEMTKVIRYELRSEISSSTKMRGVLLKLSEILVKLDEIERQIQMTHDEEIAALNAANSTLDSVSADIDALLVIVGQLQNADVPADAAALIDQLNAKLTETDAKFVPPPGP